MVYPESREDVLAGLRQTLATAGLDADSVSVAAEAGDAAATIVDQAVALHADLLVMGTHGRSGFDRFLLGSVTEKVLRKAPCPVLTVPPQAPEVPSPEVTERAVLCPIDFSPSSLQAFGVALDLARRADASLTLLHTIEWLAEEEPREFAHFSIPEYREHLITDAQEQLESLVAQEAPVNRGVKVMVAIGRAHREILRIATEKRAGLIVMGAQGRGGPALTIFGSSTEQVVRGAACPVLTVRKPVDLG
jgi:nucleotide-binding universal stress UspA family protein